MSLHLSVAAWTAAIMVARTPPTSRALMAAAVDPPGLVTSSFSTPGWLLVLNTIRPAPTIV